MIDIIQASTRSHRVGAEPTTEAVIEVALCLMCKKLLDQPGDSLSTDCGGDCWECVKACEPEPEED